MNKNSNIRSVAEEAPRWASGSYKSGIRCHYRPVHRKCGSPATVVIDCFGV